MSRIDRAKVVSVVVTPAQQPSRSHGGLARTVSFSLQVNGVEVATATDRWFWDHPGPYDPPYQFVRIKEAVEKALELTSEGEAAVLDGTSLRAEIAEIGNQTHNLGCECQNDETLSARLSGISLSLWEISQQAPTAPQPAQPDLEERIDNAVQAMAETHSTWESRCHAIMAALGRNFGWGEPQHDDAQAHIAALTAEVKRLGGLADGYGKLDLEYADLTAKVNELRGQRDAAMAKVEELTRERDSYSEFERQHNYCCCGSRMEDHDIGSGHSPVSMFDYEYSRAVDRAETAEARVAQVEEEIRNEPLGAMISVERIRLALHPEKEGG